MPREPPDRLQQDGEGAPTPPHPAPPQNSHPLPPYFPPFPLHSFWNFPCRRDLCAGAEAVLEKARCEILLAGENVSAWKVSQKALVYIQADSWASLGFQFQDIPYLRNLVAIESKVNACIHCFVGVWKFATVHDLEASICKNEGIEQFDALRLGPLLRHPLVSHYFSIPPEVTEVPRITYEEITSDLIIYLSKTEKFVEPEEFLSFLVDKYGVNSKEELGVRIQSLGFHIGLIRGAVKAENSLISSVKTKGESQLPNILPAKRALDRRFGFISKRVNEFKGKHIKFDSSEDASSESDSQSNREGGNISVQKCVSNCPYPSSIEEMQRLGLRLEMDEKSSSSRKTKKRKLGPELKMPIDIDRSMIQKFVLMWGEACRKNSLFEVICMMSAFYSSENGLTKKQPRRVFSVYPGIILVHIAVAAIKCGMADRIYDLSSRVECDDSQTPEDRMELVLPGKEDDPSTLVIRTRNLESRVTEDEILKKMECFLMVDFSRAKGERRLEKEISLLRRFHDCEIWLEREFSVDTFPSLGFGRFVEFLERNFARITPEVRRHITKDSRNLLMVINQKQLETFISQAMLNIQDPEVVPHHYITLLLKKQFPALCFDFISNKDDFQDLIRKQKKGGSLNYVYYATTLMGNSSKMLNTCKETEVTSEVQKNSIYDDHVSSKDAIDCLLKVPMLSDLRSWTHWDIIFAPKFGPLLEWLSMEGWNDEICCIAVSDGRLIRVERSSSADEFLEASIQCSPLRTALKLLSLLVLHGGADNTPLALLKCYAQRAIDAIVKGSDLNNGAPIAARFILDCLKHMPSEFRPFTAEILMSGLRSFTKDGPQIMLRECNGFEQRTMLHGIGLSLGIMEWIEDYNIFKSESSDTSSSLRDSSKNITSIYHAVNGSKVSSAISSDIDISHSELKTEYCNGGFVTERKATMRKGKMVLNNAALVIETIRREEFGLDASSTSDSALLKKQHARLGRALHCLSQELYSQDSHLLLEMVQNADDNIYPKVVEPTLVFILHADAIVILNNECGFTAENIKALCDIGNSTKKGSSGYIGHKGIGFKSVFRVTDAPEIHSNGFHVKFDLSEGPIGFVLPTIIPPCDVGFFERQLSLDAASQSWKTCIVLPFRKQLKERSEMGSIVSMFSDLHPSLLLFLHRLKCIVLKNALDGSLILMKKETLEDGMVRVSYGNERMNFLVARQKLQASKIRPDVQMTEIALAFTLEETDSGEYVPHLIQQPAFAFLPLRPYGLKFIIQGDFVLPSSREEIERNSAWNQWLLSEFPNIFVNSEASFTALPCFKSRPGKAVSAFMSFVPNVGDVHGFFSYLPQMILSKLRASRCLLLEGREEWVLPCKALRGWDDKAREVLSDDLLEQHLGLGFLDRNIVLSDTLAKSLGIREYGPKVLTDVLSSVCVDGHGIKKFSLSWLADWLIALDGTLSLKPSENEVMGELRRIRFIPLSDGSYGSTSEGPIWLPSCIFGYENEAIHDHCFPRLYAKLHRVNSGFFSSCPADKGEGSRTQIILRLLQKIGVQQLSPHEIILSHILPAISASQCSAEDGDLLIEYLSYAMLHFQNVCSQCQMDRKKIVLDLKKSNIILTNHGYKCPDKDFIHFSREFGNPLEIDKLIEPEDEKWDVLDGIYLKHYSLSSSSSLLTKWRVFFHELGVSDFVRVVQVKKQLKDDSIESEFSAWESPELFRFLSTFSTAKQRDKCIYLLEALDKTWDDLCLEADDHARSLSLNGNPINKPPFLECLHDFRWIVSTVDDELHFPKDLFYDCEQVRSVLGLFAPYAVPQVKNKRLLCVLGFKTQVTHEDALAVIKLCKIPEGPGFASTVQMSKLYNFIWEAVTKAKVSIKDQFKLFPLIFVASNSLSTWSDTLQSGTFLSSSLVYWHDPTGCLDELEKGKKYSISDGRYKTLFKIYPNLRDFFVNECGVLEVPLFGNYIDILLQLSKTMFPAQATRFVFQVFIKWADDLNSGLIKDEEITLLQKNLKKPENAVLPTKHDRWISLHPSFGISCWSDDSELQEQFQHSRKVHFIHFGELSCSDKELLKGKVRSLLQTLGILALSELVSREAIFYGTKDSSEKGSLIFWSLPYAQRFLIKSYPDKYPELKMLASERLSMLRVVGVNKLFYRNIIKISGDSSRKRYKCGSVLQDNVLYVTSTADSHSIFLELSRFFFKDSDLQLANFLHMIATMVEAGSSEEQIEMFIVNSQKIPPLPAGEEIWSFLHASSSSQEPVTPKNTTTLQSTLLQRSNWKTVNSNWPPTDWKTAPDLSGAPHFCSNPIPLPSPEESDNMDISSLVEASGDYTVTEKIPPSGKPKKSKKNSEKMQDSEEISVSLLGQTNSVHTRKTGLLGEAVAYKYLKEKYSSVSVKWVNEDGETGLPYDIIIEDNDRKEFVEVKATRSGTKEWFPISTREWQFAADKGESYVIAHVTFPGPKSAKVLLLKNPLRLCQQNVLNLALLMRTK